MTTMDERLLERVRMELGDLESKFDFQFIGDGERDHFNVEHRPFNESSVELRLDGLLMDPAANGITLDGTNGMVVFDRAPDPGELWELQGKKYRYFSDSDLRIFIQTAVGQHSHHRADSGGGAFSSNDIPPVEEYLVALNATVQALWALATDASFDIDIMAPDGVNIPRSERHRQLLEIIGARQTQYDELAAALNVGLKAIEVFTARRTAKLTNRLVPVFLPSEYDDRTWPKRVLFPQPLLGTDPVRTGIGNYDHNIITGDPYSMVLDFAFDLTGCEIKNAIRRSAVSSNNTSVGPPVGEFTQEVIDAPGGKVRLSLTGSQTRTLPYNCFWEIQATRPGEEPESRSKMRGLVRTSSNEVVR